MASKIKTDEFGNRFVNGVWIVDPKTAIAAYKRVLRMVNGYLRIQKQDLLVTDGRGLMTWKEIRYHISGALNMRIKRTRRSTKKATAPKEE